MTVIRCYVYFYNGTHCLFDIVLKKRDVIISNIELCSMSFPGNKFSSMLNLIALSMDKKLFLATQTNGIFDLSYKEITVKKGPFILVISMLLQ